MTDERFRSELREHQRARWQQSDLEAHLGKHQRYFVEYLGHPVARGELAELSTLALVIWERVLTGLDRNAQVWYAFIAPLAQERFPRDGSPSGSGGIRNSSRSPIVHDELERDVRVYAAAVDKLPLYTEWLEVSTALVHRDAIQEEIAAGKSLSPAAQKLLAEADDRLVANRHVLLKRFPEIFEERGAPREYWWWHLEKGPQVREEALAATREP
ncbi:MAG: hypothetical protein HYU88_03875 [Chloroflexi bacterium]|nr:hypothetical protein [Chloroflexota bacterium]